MVRDPLPEGQTPVPELVAETSGPASRRLLWLGGAAAVLVVTGAALALALKGGAVLRASNGSAAVKKPEGNGSAGVSVNTVRPQKKTLERTLVQPGSIEPWAQAELFAKASGYLKSIQRAATPHLAADLVAQTMAVSGPPVACAARLAAGTRVAMWQVPRKDIGTPVTAGELLLEIDTPDRLQEIVEKEALLAQRQAELEAAQTALATFEAAIRTARAQKAQAESDVRRFESEHIFRSKELVRLKELVRTRTVTPESADEKENQVNAALAAWESSQARVQTAEAEITVASSKLAAARADIKVKEALVQVAREALRQANIQADYGRIYAPFDGFITFRGVDEGDFVQNATSGQPRKLMTVTAMDRLRVVLQVPEKDAPWVHPGTGITMVLDARTGWQVHGHVARTANALEPQTRTLQAEIDLDNRDRQLLPGMYGQVTLTLQKIKGAQAIPATAVYSRRGENFILQVQNGVARRQRVRIRFDDGKEVEVVKLLGNEEVPLDGSEELIVSNKGEIADGQRVHATPLTGD
jgi:RND family efflux transporter MFP subunit